MTGGAAVSLAQAKTSFMRWRRDAMQHLQAAQQHDPEYAMAHVVEGLFLHMARDVSHRPAIDAALARARRSVGDGAVDQLYVAALAAVADGELMRMVYCFEQVLAQDPTDVFALRMCQSELFWLGEMQWSESISRSVEPHWNDSHPDYGSFLSVRAFDLEETGQYQRAERCGREAVEIDASDPWGTHAVAHVQFMQGRFADGANWLDGLRDNWADLSQIVLHLWWHRALFALEQGDLQGALAIYDDYVRNLELDMIADLPDLYIDLQNAASLLLRLELRGHSVGARWRELGQIASDRKQDHSNPFTSAHFALMLAASDRSDEVQPLLDSMQQWAHDAGTLAPRIAAAAIPAARAALAHRAGEHEKVVEYLMPARRQLWQIGGSHAQRELFFLILADSLRKLGREAQLQMVQRDIEAAGFADSMVQRYS